MEHECLGVRVLEQGGELTGLVPEVHVRRQRAQLRAGEQALHVLGAVVEEQRDVCARPDALGREPGRQTRRVVLELAPPHAPVALDDGGRVGDGVGNRLPHGCETLVHGAASSVGPGGELRQRDPDLRDLGDLAVAQRVGRARSTGRAGTRRRSRAWSPRRPAPPDRPAVANGLVPSAPSSVTKNFGGFANV